MNENGIEKDAFNYEIIFKDSPEEKEIYEKLIKKMNSIDNLNDVGPRVIGNIELNDGVKISIQASSFHYCTPRKNIPYNQYLAFEVCMNKKDVKSIYFKKHIDEYGILSYVKVEKIIEEIKKHKGIKE